MADTGTWSVADHIPPETMARLANLAEREAMATSAGSVRIKVVPDVESFKDDILDAIAEKVAQKIIKEDMLNRKAN